LFCLKSLIMKLFVNNDNMDNSILENYYDLEIKYNLIDLNQAESKKDYLGCFEPIMFADLKIKNSFVFSHLSVISLCESGAP